MTMLIQETKNKIEQQQDLLRRINEISKESAFNDKLNELISKSQTDLNYFRDTINTIKQSVYADNRVTNVELSSMDRFDDFMYTKIMDLKGQVDKLKSEGIEVPGSLQSNIDYIYLKLMEARENTEQARSDNQIEAELTHIGLSDYGKHKVQNSHVVKRLLRRISIRLDNKEAQTLLKDLGIYRDTKKGTIASKRFHDSERIR